MKTNSRGPIEGAPLRPPLVDGGRLHLRRFYGAILKGKSYGGSAVERIARASTRAEVEALYEKARGWSLSPRTARRIESAARARIDELTA